MPYIFIKSTYPSHKIDEVVKKYLEVLQKFPPDPSMGEQVANATRADGQGIVGLTVFEVKEGKFDEAMKRWMSAMTEFRNIEGYEYSMDVWATVIEAFAAIGMTPPG